jgi:predicted transglutaminase-like cysteine proteinase
MARSRKATARGRVLARVGPGVIDRLSRKLALTLVTLALVAASLVALLCATDAARAGISQIGIFRTRELHSADLNSFPKWRDMLARFERQLSECTPDRCRLDEWQQLVASLHGRTAMAQLKLVNRTLNRHRYIEDWANWELADYWETPLQFLDRSGDCEDFAIAKYLALRAGGMPAENMRIVIVRDTSRQRTHAVLAVYVRGRALILDSLYDAIVEADAIDHYEPIYSINETGWWLHRR